MGRKLSLGGKPPPRRPPVVHYSRKSAGVFLDDALEPLVASDDKDLATRAWAWLDLLTCVRTALKGRTRLPFSSIFHLDIAAEATWEVGQVEHDYLVQLDIRGRPAVFETTRARMEAVDGVQLDLRWDSVSGAWTGPPLTSPSGLWLRDATGDPLMLPASETLLRAIWRWQDSMG